MSLLGFNAVGRLALGQIQQASSAILLIAGLGTFTETGSAATFRVNEAAVGTTYAETGNTGSFRINEGAIAGSFVLTGFAANETTLFAESAGGYIVTGYPAVLTRDFYNWVNDRAPVPSWTADAVPSTTWTRAATPANSWTVDPAQQILPPVTE